ncbi:RNA polymerase I-specific transcription initiation factor-domain-containing protein [Xylariomycetidae sp. FL2044]|nr:RNA polymerase I-specific transcription initiation factor-domain-containing protein [Xylariomycetidae sp. FL2044]
MATSSDEYIPDSDDSEYQERPNRWQGPPSTWRYLNTEEIDTLYALDEIRNQNLSLHLYNAFALKHRHDEPRDEKAPVPDQDVDLFTGEKIQQDEWRPQRSWTAWPMREDKAPRPQFMTGADDPDERFTIRKLSLDMPSDTLEEILSALILRFAKERFRARPSPDPEFGGTATLSGGTDELESEPESESARSVTREMSRSVKNESASENEKMDTEGSEGKKKVAEPPLLPHLKPVVATDDELSYSLLRPTVRHLLSRLDTTLLILHNMQEAATYNQSDSSASDVSESSFRSRASSRRQSRTPTGRNRGRPPKFRQSSRRRASVPSDEPVTGIKKPGRPRIVYPRLEGENDKEYAIRIARQRKEPIPKFSDSEPFPVPGSALAPEPVPEPVGLRLEHDSGAESERDTSGEDEETPRRPKVKHKRARRRSSAASQNSAPTPRPVPRFKPRLAPRNWTDVLAAASLAGFAPQAIDRAARRCTNLFGQSMVLHTLAEGGPSDQHHSLTQTTRYVPGIPIPSIFDEEAEEGEYEELGGSQQQQHGPGSRLSSVATPDVAVTDEDRASSRGRGRARSRSRPRSRSKSASVDGTFFCTYAQCPRAHQGFGRRPNLLRHLKLVHGAEGLPMDMDVDSEDEMFGAVHVDGFLKPIKIRPGWRAGDVSEEPRKRRRGRGRDRGRGGGRRSRRRGSSGVSDAVSRGGGGGGTSADSDY